VLDELELLALAPPLPPLLCDPPPPELVLPPPLWVPPLELTPPPWKPLPPLKVPPRACRLPLWLVIGANTVVLLPARDSTLGAVKVCDLGSKRIGTDARLNSMLLLPAALSNE